MKTPLQSMTGFGRGEVSGKEYILVTEIKSVNNRFKDIRFKMSSLFNGQEMNWRAILETEVKRGTFDISVTYQKKPGQTTEFNVDATKVKNYLAKIKTMTGDLPVQINPVDFLRADFCLEDDSRQSEIMDLAEESFKKAIIQLKESRRIEGEKLIQKIQEHIKIYHEKLNACYELTKNNPEILKEKMQQKLSEKMKDLKIDEGRLLQEVIFYLEKLDVDEELNRAVIHLKKFDDIVKLGGEVGRQMDFLLQELGRETNTLGSKTNSSDVSHNVVEMKIQLEKIREQALNLE